MKSATPSDPDKPRKRNDRSARVVVRPTFSPRAGLVARSIDARPEIVRRLFTEAGANPTLETVVEIAAALGLELRLVPVTQKKRAAKPRLRVAKSSRSRAEA